MEINLIKFDNPQQQIEKLLEERGEVDEAFEEGNKIKLVSEYWDEIQVLFSLIFYEVGNEENFKATYARHIRKLEKYNKDKRIKIQRKIEV